MYNNKNKNEGSIYIFVMVVMFSVFTILITVLSTTRYQVEISETYTEYAYFESLGISAAEKMLQICNDGLSWHLADVETDILLAFQNQDIMQHAIYQLEQISRPYEGRFLLQTTQGQALFQSLLAEKIDERIWNALHPSPFEFSYEIELSTGDDHIVTYQVSAALERSITRRHRLTIEIATENTVKRRMTGIIQLALSRNSDEWIVPRLIWNQPPVWSQYSILATENITLSEGITASFQEYFDNDIVDRGTPLSQQIWTPENPVLIIDDIHADIDISQFYQDFTPIPTVIIQLHPAATVRLYASQSNKNNFQGILYTAGHVQTSSIGVQGSLIAQGSVESFNHTEFPLNFDAVPDIWEKIQISDPILYRKLTDFFLMTQFRNAALHRQSALSILKHGRFSNHKQLELNFNEFQYKLTNFKTLS